MSSEDRAALAKLLRRVSRELVEGKVLTQQWRKETSALLGEAVVEIDRAAVEEKRERSGVEKGRAEAK